MDNYSRCALVLFIWLTLVAFNTTGSQRDFAVAGATLLSLIFIALGKSDKNR